MNLIKLANWIKANWFRAHRAAVKVGPYYLLFGNDGVGDPKVAVELSSIFRWLRDHHYMVAGFSTDAEFFSWVVVVRPARGATEQKLTDVLFDMWMTACMGKKPRTPNDKMYQAVQTAIAIETVAEKPLPKAMVAWLTAAGFRKSKVAS